MSKFKVGDRVRPVSTRNLASWARGLTGVVSYIQSSYGVTIALDSEVTRPDGEKFKELVFPDDSVNHDELPKGRKDDGGKTRWSLVPRGTLKTIIKVLEHGAKKYGDNNWEQVPHARIRYYDAANRHLDSWWGGEDLDPESGLPHLAHAACCILFLLAKS